MLWATLLMVPAASAQPPLTTIQDVLYKADGTPFNGIVTVGWTSFEASDLSEIAGQTITVPISDGNAIRISTGGSVPAGATAVIQPGGSIRDEEVIKAADDAGIAMVFTGVRHFRH